jgi:hypothetical protein
VTVSGAASHGRKATIHANEGYGFPFAGNAMQVRDRTKSEMYVAVIKSQLERCGVRTRKIKVREFKEILYLNIFHLRGLDPDLAIAALTKLPRYCGVKCVLAQLSDLEERVESGADRILEAVG